MIFSDSIQGLVLALSGDGTGTDIVGALGTGGWSDGTPLAVNGMTFVELPLDIGVNDGTVIVRIIKRSTGKLTGDRELQSSRQDDTEETMAEHTFAASAKVCLELNLGGVIQVLVVQAQRTGTAVAGNYAKAGLNFAHGRL